MKANCQLWQRVVAMAVLLLVLVCPFAALCNEETSHRVTGKLVTRAETAVAIAKAVAVETYGTDEISVQLPLVAVMKGNIWHVSGQFPRNAVGGVVEVWISMKDGRVLRMTHGK